MTELIIWLYCIFLAIILEWLLDQFAAGLRIDDLPPSPGPARQYRDTAAQTTPPTALKKVRWEGKTMASDENLGVAVQG